MIVWRLRGNVTGTTECSVVYNSCALSYAHKCEQFIYYLNALAKCFKSQLHAS